MSDFEGFHLEFEPLESMEIIELGTSGKRVDRPDIALKAAGIFKEAIESTGATASIRQLRPVEENSLNMPPIAIDLDTPEDE